jgi:lipopolysaccharide biosynthesis glycosyltransferase
MEPKINVVFAADNNYVQHTAVAMASVLANTKRPQQLCFYVIDDQIAATEKVKLEQTAASLGSQVIFVQVQNEAFKGGFVSGSLTRAAYFRLDIANILPMEIQKVIYLDGDLIVKKDIQVLWQIELGDLPVGAVEDFGILASAGKCAEKTQSFGWQSRYSYFNSGVMVLNLASWRQNDYAGKLLQLITTKHYRHHDQDALNEVFMGRWVKLPLNWNVIPPIFNMQLRIALNKQLRIKAVQALKDIAILHYAGGYKPWEYECYQGFNEDYYKYLALTAYKDAAMPQPDLRKEGHSLQRQRLRLKWAGWVRGMNG